ncbi:MAG TPA: M48 family metallopeptidase [Verrucomicrobiales bacterium]|nr:M48 family metallopeptidase [Verrucomicrobiales bacterium]
MPSPPRSEPQNRVFTRSLFLSALLVFVVPLFSLWFFDFAESSFDQEALSLLSATVDNDPALTVEEKNQIVRYYRRHPVSEAMAGSGEADAAVQAMFDGSSPGYAVFRWSKRGALFCFVVAGLTLVPLLACIAIAGRSPGAFYFGLRCSLPVLRVFALVQTIVQGALIVFLSYWVTVMFLSAISPKLIIVLSLAVVAGAWVLIQSIFVKLPLLSRVEGQSLTEAEAPALWHRVREMAGRLRTEAPDRIVAGIDANFFVTGCPVALGNQTLVGRTLFVSLPLLKTMTREEADAVLAHEIAHFSGNDTEFTMKTAPLLRRFDLYLYVLHGTLAMPVFHFMNVFRCLFLKALGDHRRLREYRADRAGSTFSNPAAMGRALVKVAAYAHWRDFEGSDDCEGTPRKRDLKRWQDLEAGFPASLRDFVTRHDTLKSIVPHPFDSHPPLQERLSKLGLDPAAVLEDAAQQGPVMDSRYHEINGAAAVEISLWTGRPGETAFTLTERLLPQNEEQEKMVQRLYPPLSFTAGKHWVELQHDHIHSSQWAEPVYFRDMTGCVMKTRFFAPVVWLVVQGSITKLYPGRFRGASGDLEAAFKSYYGRYLAAAAHTRKTPGHYAAPPAGPPPLPSLADTGRV